ncbi:MAG: hypothetical protein RMA76_06990 [Deltaproteobacteria bacterium]
MKRLAWLLLLVACKGTSSTSSEAPDAIRYVAVVELDDAGDVVASGPLTSWAPTDPLFVAARGSNVRLVGYDEATLAAVGILDVAAEGPLFLSAAEGCDPRLPDATWIAAWSPSAVQTLDDAPTPALTAPRLESICPDLSPDISVDVACAEPRCTPNVVARDACARTVELDCAPGTQMTIHVDPAGRVCSELSSSFGACTSMASTIGYASNVCGSCRIDTYAPTAAATSGLATQVVKIVPGELRQPRNVGMNRQPFRQEFYEGYVLDMIALPDRIIVLGPEGGYGKRCNVPPDTANPMRLFFLDPDTLTVTSSRATEVCLTAIEADVHSDGFVGVFGIFKQWHLGRFDPDGNLVDRADFDPAAFSADGEDGGIHELHFVNDDATIVVMANIRPTNPPILGGVRTFDARTLAPIDRFGFPSRRIEYAAPGEGTTLYGFESRELDRDWYAIDLETGTLNGVRSLPVDQQFRSSSFAVLQKDGYLFTGGRGHDAVYALDPTTDEVWSASAHVFDLHIFTMQTWPADPSLIVVAGGTETFYAGGAMLFDPADRRFRYAHAVGFSESAVTNLTDDLRGGVLGVLPWTGEIVRITADP